MNFDTFQEKCPYRMPYWKDKRFKCRLTGSCKAEKCGLWYLYCILLLEDPNPILIEEKTCSNPSLSKIFSLIKAPN
jgi:hypothetical protein